MRFFYVSGEGASPPELLGIQAAKAHPIFSTAMALEHVLLPLGFCRIEHLGVIAVI